MTEEEKKPGHIKLGEKWYALVATRIHEFRSSD